MSFIDIASFSSRIKGYEYFKNKKVIDFSVENSIYTGKVKGFIYIKGRRIYLIHQHIYLGFLNN